MRRSMFRLTVGLFFFSGIDAYGQAVANGQIAGAVSDPSGAQSRRQRFNSFKRTRVDSGPLPQVQPASMFSPACLSAPIPWR